MPGRKPSLDVLRRIWNDRLSPLFVVTLVAFTLRLLVALLAYAGRDVVQMLWPRGIEALAIAKSLLAGDGFSSPFYVPTGPTAFLPPGYPVVIAGIEKLFGVATPASAWTILIMQCAFSALTCIAIYFLAARLFNAQIAKSAAWVWALFPYAMILPTNLIWESSLSALTMTCGLLLLVSTRDSSPYLTWAWIGVFWAATFLINDALLSLLPAFLLWIALRDRSHRRHAILCFIVFLACLMPWSLRNYAVLHQIVPVRDNFWLELWIGNHQTATLTSDDDFHPAEGKAELKRFRELGEIGYMHERRDLALSFISSHPSLFLENAARRANEYWFMGWHAPWMLFSALTLAGIAGLCILYRTAADRLWIFAIPLVIFPIPYYLADAYHRYQHPIQPLLAILCAFPISAITRLEIPALSFRNRIFSGRTASGRVFHAEVGRLHAGHATPVCGSRVES